MWPYYVHVSSSNVSWPVSKVCRNWLVKSLTFAFPKVCRKILGENPHVISSDFSVSQCMPVPRFPKKKIRSYCRAIAPYQVSQIF